MGSLIQKTTCGTTKHRLVRLTSATMNCNVGFRWPGIILYLLQLSRCLFVDRYTGTDAVTNDISGSAVLLSSHGVSAGLGAFRHYIVPASPTVPACISRHILM